MSATIKADTNSNSNPSSAKLNSQQEYQALLFTTPAYNSEAMRLLLDGANQMAHDLNLPEALPITRINLVAAYISPPRMAQGSKVIGNITTSNYVYAPFSGSRFSLVRTHLQDEYLHLKKNFFWPISQLDTNAAYHTAVQIMKSASADVEALDRNCTVSMRAFMPEGEHGKHFVPIYWVSWNVDAASIASIEFFAPTKTIRQLYVKTPEYILRPPLEITNLDFLLSQTNAPATNSPATHATSP